MVKAPAHAFERRFGTACEEQDGPFPLPNDMRSRPASGVNQGGTAKSASSLCGGEAFLFARTPGTMRESNDLEE